MRLRPFVEEVEEEIVREVRKDAGNARRTSHAGILSVTLRTVAEAFTLLRRDLVAAGLLDRAYGYYAWRTLLSFAILGGGLVLAFLAPVVAPVVIAFGTVQVALIGHDAGHLAIFKGARANVWLGTICWTLSLGVSFAYWTARHNNHHANPNHTERDPDVQWAFGPMLTPFLAFTFRVEGWRFAVVNRNLSELACLAVNTVVWLLPSTFIGPAWLTTFLVSQTLASLYLAAVVAPNHIGMPIWAAGVELQFLERQLLSSRNVSPGRLTDFVFGGLNYQVEHHLFPSMPRSHFSAARVLVKAFCTGNGLPYAESKLISVYRMVLSELPRVGRAEPA